MTASDSSRGEQWSIASVARLLKPGILPFTWAVLFGVFALAYRLLNWPSPAELVGYAKALLGTYGWRITTFAAFVEGTFMVSVYAPGSLVVAVAVFVADEAAVPRVAFQAWLGFVAALPLNYLLGREGFYRLLLALGGQEQIARMQLWLDRRGRVALFLAACHPNILAIAAVCMGITRRGLWATTIYGALFMLPWLTAVVIGIRMLQNNVNVTDSNQTWYFIAGLMMWGVVLVIRNARKQGIPASEMSLP